MRADRALRPESAIEKHHRDLEEADRLADELTRHRAKDPAWLARKTQDEKEADRRADMRADAHIYGG
jgi:hypothetical protein